MLLDIETAPIILASFTLYEANAVYVLRDTYILSVAYKWLGDSGGAKSKALPDFPRYKRHKHCDKALCGFIWKLLDKADIVVAHNGDRFDIKKINSRLIVHGFREPSQYKTIDTLKEARKKFKFDSNKQDNISRYLGNVRKLPNTGADLWKRCCEDHDQRAWAEMGAYNRRDVDGLEENFISLRYWMSNHPNLNLYTGRNDCPRCQSPNKNLRGKFYGKTIVRQRWKCDDCGKEFQGEIIRA